MTSPEMSHVRVRSDRIRADNTVDVVSEGRWELITPDMLRNRD